jgi:hypothetical protein
MPRTAQPASNFTSDKHTLYAGWVVAAAKRHLGNGAAKVVTDDDGNYTPYVDLTFATGVEVRLMIPAPPEGWDPFAAEPVEPKGLKQDAAPGALPSRDAAVVKP